MQLIFTSIPLGNKKGILPKCSHVKVKLSSLPIHKRNKDLVHQRNMEKLVGKQTFLEYIAEMNSCKIHKSSNYQEIAEFKIIK